MCSQVLRDYITCAPQCSRSSGSEYKNILKTELLSSKCFQIKLLGDANFGAIGSIGRVSESIPAHLEPGALLSGGDYYNVYMK